MSRSATIRVNNSGLILYWPFLPRYFEQLGLLKDDAFLNDESRNRAVYLLQYLAFNQTDFPEHLLTLNKLLVGMDLDAHLSAPIRLTAGEQEESISLMNAFIGHWDKVNNSSPEGIQETFIQREGQLDLTEAKMALMVETKTFDVLMQSLPWSISMIKLPWMPNLLEVAWI